METAIVSDRETFDKAEIIPYDDRWREGVANLWDVNFSNSNRNSYYRDIDVSLRENPGLFWLAVKDGNLAGTCVGATDGHRSWIYYLCVEVMMRRQGIGTMLLEHVESVLLESGSAQVGLHVYNRRFNAIEFYRSRGYFVEETCCMGKRLA